MKITIEQQTNKKGKYWLATRGNENTRIQDNHLYQYLMVKKTEGYSITFKRIEECK